LYAVLPLPIYYCFDGCGISFNLPVVPFLSLFIHWLTLFQSFMYFVFYECDLHGYGFNLLEMIVVNIIHIILMFGLYYFSCLVVNKFSKKDLE